MEDDNLILESEIKKHLKKERSFYEEAFCDVIGCEPNDYELEEKEDYFIFKHKEEFYKVITENQLYSDLANDCEFFDYIEHSIPPIAVLNVLIEAIGDGCCLIFMEPKFWTEFAKICKKDVSLGLYSALSKKSKDKLVKRNNNYIFKINSIINQSEKENQLYSDIEEVLLEYLDELYNGDIAEDVYSRIVWLILHFSDFDNTWPVYERTIQNVCDTLIDYGQELLCEFKDGKFDTSYVSIGGEGEEEMLEQFCVFSVDDYYFNNSNFREVLIEKYIEPKEPKKEF